MTGLPRTDSVEYLHKPRKRSRLWLAFPCLLLLILLFGMAASSAYFDVWIVGDNEMVASDPLLRWSWGGNGARCLVAFYFEIVDEETGLVVWSAGAHANEGSGGPVLNYMSSLSYAGDVMRTNDRFPGFEFLSGKLRPAHNYVLNSAALHCDGSSPSCPCYGTTQLWHPPIRFRTASFPPPLEVTAWNSCSGQYVEPPAITVGEYGDICLGVLVRTVDQVPAELPVEYDYLWSESSVPPPHPDPDAGWNLDTFRAGLIGTYRRIPAFDRPGQWYLHVCALDGMGGYEDTLTFGPVISDWGQVVVLADPVLNQVVHDLLDRPLEEPLYEQDRFVDLSVSGLGIETLEGIDGFQSQLMNVDLSGNPICDITQLGAHSTIQILNLQDCEVEDIGPLATLGNLLDVNLAGNQISSLEPLLSNSGIGSDTQVSLGRLPICALMPGSVLREQVSILVSRGVQVRYTDSVPDGVLDLGELVVEQLAEEDQGAEYQFQITLIPNPDLPIDELQGLRYFWGLSAGEDEPQLEAGSKTLQIDWREGTFVADVPGKWLFSLWGLCEAERATEMEIVEVSLLADLGTLWTGTCDQVSECGSRRVEIHLDTEYALADRGITELRYYWGPRVDDDDLMVSVSEQLPVTWQSGFFEATSSGEWQFVLWGVRDSERCTEWEDICITFVDKFDMGELTSSSCAPWSECSIRSVDIDLVTDLDLASQGIDELRYYWGEAASEEEILAESTGVPETWRGGTFEATSPGDWQLVVWGVRDSERCTEWEDIGFTFTYESDLGELISSPCSSGQECSVRTVEIELDASQDLAALGVDALRYYWGPAIDDDDAMISLSKALPLTWRSEIFEATSSGEWQFVLWGECEANRCTAWEELGFTFTEEATHLVGGLGETVTLDLLSSDGVVIDGRSTCRVEHGFNGVPSDDLEPGDQYSLDLSLDGETVPLHSLPTVAQGYSDPYQRYSLRWEAVFEPGTLAEGEHTIQGIWTWSFHEVLDETDCTSGCQHSESITITVEYPESP